MDDLWHYGPSYTQHTEGRLGVPWGHTGLVSDFELGIALVAAGVVVGEDSFRERKQFARLSPWLRCPVG